MKEARTMVPEGIHPDSAEGIKWIGQWLMSQGISSQTVDLTAGIKNLQDSLIVEMDTERKKGIQNNIDQLQRKLNDLIMGSIGAGGTEEIISATDIYTS
jgi:hypothetical protein